MESIFSETKRSFTALDQLLELLTTQGSSLAVDLEDEIGRLRVWSSNLGAAVLGPASLDSRLREAPMMKENVLRLLEKLLSNAEELLAIFRGDRLPYELQTVESDPESEQESLSSDSDSDTHIPDIPNRPEADQRLINIEDIVTHLYKAWHRIRGPGSRSRPLKAAMFQERDPETNIDRFDILALHDENFVREAILDARREAKADGAVNTKLASRLAKAITLRRRHLGYWEKHQKKLKQMVKQVDMSRGDSKNVVAPSSAPSTAILSATEVTAFVEAGVDAGDDAMSEASSMSAASSVNGNAIALPPIPPQEDDGSFVCSLCYAPCPSSLAYKRAWRAHVFRDLQPYQCTYDDCPNGDETYARKREWLQHEQTAHRSTYWCPKHPSQKFETRENLIAHLDKYHASDVTQVGKQQLTEFALKTDDDTRTICPICGAFFGMPSKLHKHLAYHMERFAAFSLSRTHFVTEEDEADSEAADGSRASSFESSSIGIGTDEDGPKSLTVDSGPAIRDTKDEHTNDTGSVHQEISRIFEDRVADRKLELDDISQMTSASRYGSPVLHQRDAAKDTKSPHDSGDRWQVLSTGRVRDISRYKSQKDREGAKIHVNSSVGPRTAEYSHLGDMLQSLHQHEKLPHLVGETTPSRASQLRQPSRKLPKPKVDSASITVKALDDKDAGKALYEKLHPLDYGSSSDNTRQNPQCWDHGCNGREFPSFEDLDRHQSEEYYESLAEFDEEVPVTEQALPIRVGESTREKPRCWDHDCNGREFSSYSDLLRHQREEDSKSSKRRDEGRRMNSESVNSPAKQGYIRPQRDVTKAKQASGPNPESEREKIGWTHDTSSRRSDASTHIHDAPNERTYMPLLWNDSDGDDEIGLIQKPTGPIDDEDGPWHSRSLQDLNPRRQIYPKVHRKDIAVETLRYLSLDWEYDRHDPDYIVIMHELTFEETDELFAHTRALRSRSTPKLLDEKGKQAQGRSKET